MLVQKRFLDSLCQTSVPLPEVVPNSRRFGAFANFHFSDHKQKRENPKVVIKVSRPHPALHGTSAELGRSPPRSVPVRCLCQLYIEEINSFQKYFFMQKQKLMFGLLHIFLLFDSRG